ncbi:MAG: Phosphate transport system permease protein PstC [bacterium ADurb.Bin429]|nr:MAG: Phosphate transport system permease protein PstC [bacterium ADurb.Bin429]
MAHKPHLRRLKDQSAGRVIGGLTWIAATLVIAIGLALLARARPLLDLHPLRDLLTSSEWSPLRGQFGFFPFIVGTLAVTLLAMLLAVPPCLLTAIYLSEYAPARLRQGVKPVVDVLAGIPSVVYGVWGTLTVVPVIRDYVTPWVSRALGFIPLFRADNPTGYGVLAGGVVLAVMVFPIIISVTEEVIRAVPYGMREAALALGATRWQMIKTVVLRRARPGVIAAIVLGFSRAFGETMAVMMVTGNVARIPRSIFDPAYTLPSLIANNYGEMMSIPLYDAALLTAALVLLIVVLIFTIAARIVLARAVKSAA